MARTKKRLRFSRPITEINEAVRNVEEKNAMQVVFIAPNSTYFNLRNYILRKPVRLISKSSYGQEIEFINDYDRAALNNAAGWTEKKTYIIDFAKLRKS